MHRRHVGTHMFFCQMHDKMHAIDSRMKESLEAMPALLRTEMDDLQTKIKDNAFSSSEAKH